MSHEPAGVNTAWVALISTGGALAATWLTQWHQRVLTREQEQAQQRREAAARERAQDESRLQSDAACWKSTWQAMHDLWRATDAMRPGFRVDFPDRLFVGDLRVSPPSQEWLSAVRRLHDVTAVLAFHDPKAQALVPELQQAAHALFVATTSVAQARRLSDAARASGHPLADANLLQLNDEAVAVLEKFDGVYQRTRETIRDTIGFHRLLDPTGTDRGVGATPAADGTYAR